MSGRCVPDALARSGGFVAELVSRQYKPLGRETGAAFADRFRKDGYCVLPHFFAPAARELLRAEGDRLVQEATPRDLSIAEFHNTVRRMHTIGTIKLSSLTSLIPMIYFDPDLREFLSAIAGEDALIAPDENERYVVNALLQEGDRHGAHIDDYAFAFNIFTDCPPPEGGGELNLAKNSTEFNDLSNGRSLKVSFHPGDVCFLRSDTSVHEVLPLTGNGRRIAFNLVYRSVTIQHWCHIRAINYTTKENGYDRCDFFNSLCNC